MKTETCKLYSRVFWILLPNQNRSILFRAIRFKSWVNFSRHSVHFLSVTHVCIVVIIIIIQSKAVFYVVIVAIFVIARQALYVSDP